MASELRAGVVEVEQTRESWLESAGTLPRKVLAGVSAHVKRRYKALKHRYGPRYTTAMVSVAFVALFSPIPGSVPVAVALVVVVAEVHRVISKRGGLLKAIAKESAMSINCDFTLQGSATPAQLTTLGSALWGWCNRAAGGAGIYQHLNSQALADLIAGKFPASDQWRPQTRQGGIHFTVRDEVSHDRQATIDRLRREIPAKGLDDIVVDGTSWK